MSHKDGNKIETSAILTVVGILLLFGSAVGTILIAPNFVDRSWVEPTSPFQVQMYEEADPYFYIGRSSRGIDSLEYVHHLKAGHTLLAFQENEELQIQAPLELQEYVTHAGEEPVKLTSRLLMLRPLADAKKGAVKTGESPLTPPKDISEAPIEELPGEPAKTSDRKQVMELYEIDLPEAFAVASSDDFLSNYIDHAFLIVDKERTQRYHNDPGVIFIKNPQEYRVVVYEVNGDLRYRFDPNGKTIQDLDTLTKAPFGFVSRQTLIRKGEDIYKIEGCWYCHTDQTRTLIQDTVANGTESFAAPPSSANEYIFQHTSFLGTRRIGPDLSRVGVKRPSRDWHKAHFWSPKTASLGSIMPSFRHLFTYDPRGTTNAVEGVPNLEFEALFQYLLTKGTRLLPPNQSWWTGKDPLNTNVIIEGLVNPHEH